MDDLDHVLEKHKALIAYIARQYASRHNEVEDLIQQGMLAVVKVWHLYDPERGKLSSWISSVVRNDLRVFLRDHGTLLKISLRDKQNGTYPHVFSFDQHLVTHPAESVHEEDHTFDILRHLKCLEGREVEIIKAMLEGHSQRDIADMLAVSQMTVSRDYRKALGRLKRCAGL